jgi:hypothetical protein
MLHSFWYDESSCVFTQVLEADPTCAMAHWGIAMSLYHPLWSNPTNADLSRGASEVQKARALGVKTEREKGYIDAIAAFYDAGHVTHPARAKAYESAMERMYRLYPADREAAAFYSLALLGAADVRDTQLSAQKKAGQIAERIMAAQPDHPGAAHYTVHAYDYPELAKKALPAARRYAQIAPSAPHALHMPSHTFVQLGLWQEAVDSNIASEAAARNYASKAKMDGAWEEQLHAMDYLAYGYLQLGRDAEAAKVVDELRSIKKVVPASSTKSAYAFAAIPARYAIERRQWREAARLVPRSTSLPRATALTYFARGYARARLRDVAGAREDLVQLANARSQLAAHSNEGANASALVEVQRLAVEAWIAWAEQSNEKALRLMQASADLEDTSDDGPVTPGPIVRARELLGELLLELHQPESALAAFEATLNTVPHRFNAMYGLARAKRALGDQDGARALMQSLAQVCGGKGCDALRFSDETVRN